MISVLLKIWFNIMFDALAVEKFLKQAKNVTFGCGYNVEQYLGILYHCQYNVSIALNKLRGKRSKDFDKASWPRAEQKRFKKAFKVCGKDFREIRRSVVSEF